MKFKCSAMFVVCLLTTLAMSSAEPTTPKTATTCEEVTCGEYQTCVEYERGPFCMDCWHKHMTCGTTTQFPGCIPYCWNTLKEKCLVSLKKLNQTCSVDLEQLQESSEKLVEESNIMKESIKDLNQSLLALTTEANRDKDQMHLYELAIQKLNKSLQERNAQNTILVREKNAMNVKLAEFTKVFGTRSDNLNVTKQSLESQVKQLETDLQELWEDRDRLVIACAVLSLGYVAVVVLLVLYRYWRHRSYQENKVGDAEKAKMIGNPVDNLGIDGHEENCYGHTKLHNVTPVQPELEQSDMAIK